MELVSKRETSTLIFRGRVVFLPGNWALCWIAGNLAASGQISLKEVLAALSGEAESAGDAGMLDLLKKILNLPGMDKAVISPEGLEDLEELLIKAGYSRTDVSDLFAGLAEDDESGDIPLKSILDALDESGIRPDDPDASEEDGANFLAVSYNPFIESILTALGIPEVEAGSIMALSQSQGRGIDLDILINKLQELQKQAFQSGRVYQADANDRSLAVFLDHAGVESGGEKNSLGDFLSFLEKMRFNGEQDGSLNYFIPEADSVSTSLAGDLKGLLNYFSPEADSVSTSPAGDLKGLLNYFSPEADSVATSPAGDSTGLLNSFFKNIRIPDHGDAGVAGNGSMSIDRTDIEKGLAQFLKLFEGQPGVGQAEAFTGNGDLEISSDLLRLVEQAGSQVRGEKMTEGSSPRGNQVTAALDRSERRVIGLEAGASAGTPFKEPDLTGDPEAVKNRPGPRTLPAYVANQVGKNLAPAETP